MVYLLYSEGEVNCIAFLKSVGMEPVSTEVRL
jgi:hypothetical protein